ncbi:MAG: amidohydrolase family protein, partial [Clostridia bacterium]|nr:amidohydrolase family protein [Clostridia bacterium]
YRAYMERTPKTAHIKQYVGHGPLRRAVMGTENRAPTRAELDSMKAMLREAMENGAMGMTTGLIYPPGGFSKQDELTELCKVVAEYNGVYATHMREEGDLVVESVREAIETTRDAGCRLDISHHKVCGHKNWGKSKETLALIDEANAAGHQVAFDVYPYTASMTSLSACLPLTEFVYPKEERVARLRDGATRALIRGQMERGEVLKFSQLTGFDKILLIYCSKTPQHNGKTIAALAQELGIDPYDAFFDILADNQYTVSATFFTMCDDDLCNIFCHERAMLGTDGLVYAMNTPTHPRGFCSFPHAIDFFVKQKKLLSLESAIRKMTGFTADWLSVKNKGYIKEGYDADLVIFDYAAVAGGFTYAQPIRPNPGIEYVIVDGRIVWQDGALTGAAPGRFLPHGL